MSVDYNYRHVYLSFMFVTFLSVYFIIQIFWICVIYVSVVLIVYKFIKNLLNPKLSLQGKAVLITGCDTGFGHDLTRRLDQHGCIVFATCLHPGKNGALELDRATSNRVHIIPLDVGSDKSVLSALKYVQKHCPSEGLWGIVNNAGFNVMGDVEWLTVPLYHKAVNVNFYGAVRVTRTFLYLVRKAKGRVVNVSSGRGVSSFPRDSVYHVTKHCLESYSDSLRLEMTKFGVKVSVILPGHYGRATACQDSIQFQRYRCEKEEMWEHGTEEMRQTYGKPYLNSILEGQSAAMETSARTTVPVIDALVDALRRSQPNTRYIVGGSCKLIDRSAMITRLYPYLPTFMSDYYIRKITGIDNIPVSKKKSLSS